MTRAAIFIGVDKTGGLPVRLLAERERGRLSRARP